MTTETTETLRQKANEATAKALGYSCMIAREWREVGQGTMSDEDFLLMIQNPDRVREITEAALEAVEFDALMEEREAMREALRWYGVQVRRIGNDFLNQDNQSLLVGIKDITVDFGKRAKTALKEQPQ